MGTRDTERSGEYEEREREPGRRTPAVLAATPGASGARHPAATNRALARALAGTRRQAAPGRGLTTEGALLARLQRRQPSALQRQPTSPPPRDAKHPENFPTYEGWLASFGTLATFTSHDEAPKGGEVNFTVLGDKAASREKKPPAAEKPPDPIGPDKADTFIDHPTDDWVKANLPEELRQTAYRLPSDCADIAVILRHVWLFAHKRSEHYGGFTVGFVPGETDAQRSNRVHGDMGGINTPNVSIMVNAYTDSAGNPLRTIAELGPLLHAGDILVWEHHAAAGKPPDPTRPRSGGHTQTIVSITREKDGKVTSIATLQGNQPLPKESGEEFRHAAGRRIEARALEDPTDLEIPATKTRSLKRLWDFGDGHTTLVVAGPPRAADRPAPGKEGGKTVRHLTDWIPVIAKGDATNLQGRFEAPMREAQSLIERGIPNTEVEGEARAVGHATRQRLAELDAKLAKAKQPADSSVRDSIVEALKEMETGRGSTAAAAVKALFGAVRGALEGTVAQAGWSDAAASSKNYGERIVGHMRRIPLDGLPAGATQAIVVLPASITGGTDAVDVLLHFHGHNSGYADARDISLDDIEGQLETSKRRMVAVLPQGTNKSDFGAFDTNEYLKAVFAKLTELKIWSPAPPRGAIVMAGHSGGGKATTDLLAAGGTGTHGEIALFDGINGPGELSVVETWVTKQLDDVLPKLNVPKVKGNSAEEDAVLRLVVRLRAYHSGAINAKPTRAKLDYPGLHATLKATIAKWFSDHAGELSPHAARELAARFQVISTGQKVHDRMVGGQSAPESKKGALLDALTAP